jgi:methylenetetrahydrofolate dehydrogenase (NADP+) / methenyltetrahydrofolate cyclohydrolase
MRDSMNTRIIDGIAIARAVRAEWRPRAEALSLQGCRPGLAAIKVGDSPAARVYLRNKVRACAETGIYSEVHELPGDCAEDEVLKCIRALNADERIHGILVQLPLPQHISGSNVVDAISADKDVDGFHFYNLGRLVAGHSTIPPCTPYGVMRLLEYENIPVRGQHAVIVGAGNIVGKPMAIMLLQKGATVTICNSKTRDLALHTRQADILVVAVGKPKLVGADMVKQGAVVIDVGINRLPDGRLAGDVDFDGLLGKAGALTPVPGGVGPMTVTMLLINTIEAAERALARRAAA